MLKNMAFFPTKRAKITRLSTLRVRGGENLFRVPTILSGIVGMAGRAHGLVAGRAGFCVLLPGFGVDSLQVLGHPTSKCDASINLLIPLLVIKMSQALHKKLDSQCKNVVCLQGGPYCSARSLQFGLAQQTEGHSQDRGHSFSINDRLRVAKL